MFEQHNHIRAQYGDHLLENLSADLTRARGKGFSVNPCAFFTVKTQFVHRWTNWTGASSSFSYPLTATVKENCLRKKPSTGIGQNVKYSDGAGTSQHPLNNY
ncbi:MAG: hypothetical protein A2Z81_02650 [Omnitrophica WOR_2 bacterium GWA2_45_18]|nr:MAG: hypothetical protein A2Z81_02650 [Omnitrophica WOR_2 bacterium GWA2_45_18]